MSQINIREAERKDVPALLFLIKELAAFERGLSEVTMTEDELLNDGFGERPYYKAIVAECDNVIYGTAIYYYAYSTWNGKCLYLEDLIVSRKHRSEGVGKLLMEEVIRIAKREKAKRLSWQVLDWNVDAQDFYLKMGADLDGEWLNGRMNEEQIKRFEE